MGWHAKAFNDDKNYPKGEYVFFSTPYLVPSKIQQMQQELQAVVTKKLADAGINFEGQEFFPPLIGKDFYDKYPRVLTSWQSLEFLQQHNVQVDIVPILQKYETMENAYVDAIRACRDKVNELSGFPVWEFFEHASMGQRPFITLNVPVGTENAPQSYLPFNSGAMFRNLSNLIIYLL